MVDTEVLVGAGVGIARRLSAESCGTRFFIGLLANPALCDGLPGLHCKGWWWVRGAWLAPPLLGSPREARPTAAKQVDMFKQIVKATVSRTFIGTTDVELFKPGAKY